jgi:hypothetical protein
MVLRFDYLNNKLIRVKRNIDFWKSMPVTKDTNQEINENITRLAVERAEIKQAINNLNKLQK